MIHIVPGISAGLIKVGDDIKKVRSIFNNSYYESIDGNTIFYSYEKSTYQVEYINGHAVCIGVNTPLEAEYNGINLSHLNYGEIINLFQHSEEKYGDDSTLTFMDLGIGFYFDDLPEEVPQPKQVLVFKNGYYDKVMHTFKGFGNSYK